MSSLSGLSFARVKGAELGENASFELAAGWKVAAGVECVNEFLKVVRVDDVKGHVAANEEAGESRV